MKISATLLRRYRFRNVHKPAPELSSGIGKYTKDFSNLPERYIVRKTAKVNHISEDHPSYVPRLNKFQAQFHGTTRPWTDDYWSETGAFNEYDRHPDIVQPIREEDWMWFRGDVVEVLVGKDKGKRGIINMVVQERNWVIVEGLNCKYEVRGKTRDYPGVCAVEEQPLLVTSEVKLVDPTDDQSCDVEWHFDEYGQRVRVSTRSHAVIPIPTDSLATIDYRHPSEYLENKDKDTSAGEASVKTFKPKLATFEMDLMKEYDIQETRTPSKTFWY